VGITLGDRGGGRLGGGVFFHGKKTDRSKDRGVRRKSAPSVLLREEICLNKKNFAARWMGGCDLAAGEGETGLCQKKVRDVNTERPRRGRGGRIACAAMKRGLSESGGGALN